MTEQNQSQTTKKPFSFLQNFKYKFVIFILSLLLLASVAGFVYVGYNGYQVIENQKAEIEKLKSERDISVDDLKTANEKLTAQLEECTTRRDSLDAKLKEANAELERLRPKDIRELDFKTLKSINTNAGDFWLNPVYVDVNGDNRLDGIFAYRQGGVGEFLNVYVYAYLNGNNLTELLKAERYLKGNFVYLSDQGILEITSEAGTPDSPYQAKSRFKWDPTQNKMMLIKNQE